MASRISTHRLIAQEAGLSPTTVSLVLNNRADRVGIKAETRQKVLEIARRLNYVRNPLAVGLGGGRTQTVGLLWSLAGPHSAEGMVRNLVLRTQRRGYTSHMADSLSDPTVVERQLLDYRQRRVDAVVVQLLNGNALTPDMERQLKEFAAAVVVCPQPPAGDLDWIHHDRLTSLRQAADHFAAIGRRRPGILISAFGGQDKIDAFLNRCRKRGMKVDERSLLNLHYSPGPSSRKEPLMEAYHEAMQSCGDFDFDCLLCSTDEGAVVAMKWLAARGLRVPEDVAVIGFNNAIFSQWLNPALASVDRQDDEVAQRIEEMIFSRLEDESLPARRERIEMRLVIRESGGWQSGQDRLASTDPRGKRRVKHLVR